jgi:hypothetical protein
MHIIHSSQCHSIHSGQGTWDAMAGTFIRTFLNTIHNSHCSNDKHDIVMPYGLMIVSMTWAGMGTLATAAHDMQEHGISWCYHAYYGSSMYAVMVQGHQLPHRSTISYML